MNREEALDILKEGKDLISDFRKEFDTARNSLCETITNRGLDNQPLEKYKVLFRYYGDKFREEVYRNAGELGVLDNWYSRNGSGANITTAINTVEKKPDTLSLVTTELYAYSTGLRDPLLNQDEEFDRLLDELEIECDAVMNWVDILLDDIKAFEEML